MEQIEPCVNCDKAAAEGCRLCDGCLDEANRLWQTALQARFTRIHIAQDLRKAEASELQALERFNRFNATSAAQREQLEAV
jgi:hypothetical protein